MNDSADSTVGQLLTEEHRVIQRVLHVLEQLVKRSQADNRLEVEALDKCVSFFRLFADACHHAKEEDLLFPVLEQRGVPREGGPIGVMLDEHRQARGLIGQMRQRLDDYRQGDKLAAVHFRETASAYVNLMNMHIFKEDNRLFPMGDHLMPEGDQRRLCRQFCEVDCRDFEGCTQQQLQALAEELESHLESR